MVGDRVSLVLKKAAFLQCGLRVHAEEERACVHVALPQSCREFVRSQFVPWVKNHSVHPVHLAGPGSLDWKLQTRDVGQSFGVCLSYPALAGHSFGYAFGLCQSECGLHTDCPNGSHCEADRCVSRCLVDNDCGSGMQCNERAMCVQDDGLGAGGDVAGGAKYASSDDGGCSATPSGAGRAALLRALLRR